MPACRPWFVASGVTAPSGYRSDMVNTHAPPSRAPRCVVQVHPLAHDAHAALAVHPAHLALLDRALRAEVERGYCFSRYVASKGRPAGSGSKPMVMPPSALEGPRARPRRPEREGHGEDPRLGVEVDVDRDVVYVADAVGRRGPRRAGGPAHPALPGALVELRGMLAAALRRALRLALNPGAVSSSAVGRRPVEPGRQPVDLDVQARGLAGVAGVALETPCAAAGAAVVGSGASDRESEGGSVAWAAPARDRGDL